MRHALLALSFAALLLGGCDRFADDATPAPPTAAPQASPNRSYVKGASFIALGASAQFRSEAVVGAVRYTWLVLSAGETPADANHSGDVVVVPTSDTRIATVIGREVGPVTVQATALDVDNRVLAVGRVRTSVTR